MVVHITVQIVNQQTPVAPVELQLVPPQIPVVKLVEMDTAIKAVDPVRLQQVHLLLVQQVH